MAVTLTVMVVVRHDGVMTGEHEFLGMPVTLITQTSPEFQLHVSLKLLVIILLQQFVHG